MHEMETAVLSAATVVVRLSVSAGLDSVSELAGADKRLSCHCSLINIDTRWRQPVCDLSGSVQ